MTGLSIRGTEGAKMILKVGVPFLQEVDSSSASKPLDTIGLKGVCRDGKRRRNFGIAHPKRNERKGESSRFASISCICSPFELEPLALRNQP